MNEEELFEKLSELLPDLNEDWLFSFQNLINQEIRDRNQDQIFEEVYK